MDEKVFFEEGGVRVTNSRFVVPSQTFAMAGITSVQHKTVNGKLLGPALAIAVGFITLLGGAGSGDGGGAIAIGIAILAGGAILFASRIKPVHHVKLRVASGETEAFTSKDGDYIERIVVALNNAMVYRG
jgi:hypothetical protein